LAQEMPEETLSEAKRKDLEGMGSLEIHERNRDTVEDIFKIETMKKRKETLKKMRESDSEKDSESKKEESDSEMKDSDLEGVFNMETLTRGSETMRMMREEGSETLRRMRSDGMETMRRNTTYDITMKKKKESVCDKETETMKRSCSVSETLKRVGSDKKKKSGDFERDGSIRKRKEGLQDTLYSGFTRASTLQSSLKRRSKRGREGESPSFTYFLSSSPSSTSSSF